MVNGGGDKEESAGEASLNADSDQRWILLNYTRQTIIIILFAYYSCS